MGCDIHFHTEVKINGRWEHYGNPSMVRNYKLFTLLAGVRDYSDERDDWIKPYRKADYEFPEDLNVVTQKTLIDNEDTHSIITYDSKQIHEFYNYLKDKEIKMINKWNREEYLFMFLEHEFIGYLDGNGWDILRYPEDKPNYIEDVRWIIGFDN